MHKYLYYPLILLSISATSNALATQNNQQLHQQIKELRLQLDKIDHSINATNHAPVQFGKSKTQLDPLIQRFSWSKTRLLRLLNQVADLKSQQFSINGSNLYWTANSNVKNNEHHIINFGSEKQPLSVCRAQFIGVRPGIRATYPGQLTSRGCRITYAGFAFYFTKYDVLVGNNSHLTWIPIATIKKQTPTTHPRQPRRFDAVVAPGYYRAYQPNPFDFNISINGKKALTGGHQGGKPVLICKATYQSQTKIGKLVFYRGNNRKWHDICNIGNGNKEIVINKDFDILFGSANNKKSH